MPSFKIMLILLLKNKILKVFTIYGRSGQLGHVTMTIYINFRSPFPRNALIGLAVSEQGPGEEADNPLWSHFFMYTFKQSI